jgi:hypothetical protein
LHASFGRYEFAIVYPGEWKIWEFFELPPQITIDKTDVMVTTDWCTPKICFTHLTFFLSNCFLKLLIVCNKVLIFFLQVGCYYNRQCPLGGMENLLVNYWWWFIRGDYEIYFAYPSFQKWMWRLLAPWKHWYCGNINLWDVVWLLGNMTDYLRHKMA